jgi:uncharacterized LabA/DUF88 family protein
MVTTVIPRRPSGIGGVYFAEASLPARVMVFLDYQNVHLIAHHRFHPAGTSATRTHIDPLKIGKLLVSRRRFESALVGVRVYRGEPSPEHQPAAAAASKGQARAWGAAPGVTVVRRPLRYPQTWPRDPAQEKGIDVALALDFLRLAVQMEYDVGILFSSDTDLLPALEAVVDLKLARVEVAAWHKAPRLRFRDTQLPWCHHLTEADYLSVADPTDYTKPP